MISSVIFVNNPSGLHARPASMFVMKAKQFSSEIILRRIDGQVPFSCNAKSLIHVLSGGFSQGTCLEIQADGPDEEEAIISLVDLIKNDLGT